ncbi:MAG: DNA internalization-related competence protein ComEC/Rec2 [Pseudomarimonas sp.]
MSAVRAQRGWFCPPLLSPLSAVLMILGVCLGLLPPELPSMPLIVAGLTTAGLLALRIAASRLIALPVIGLCWVLLHAHWGMQARLPHALEGADLALTIQVIDLPERAERQQRFVAIVLTPPPGAPELAGEQVRLSWFNETAADLKPGERWQVTARMKRPRGTLNPGGFDYERFALEHGIVATGYLRDAPAPLRLHDEAGVDAIRLRISAQMATVLDQPATRFLRGLAVGDLRALSGPDWERLRATGLTHLLAISGLHIGLLAGLGALLARMIYWCWPTLGLRLPRPLGMAMLALPFATAYSALAGFGLPAVRTLLMIACVLLAVLWRRALLPSQGLALAAIAAIIVDPLALLGPSFWLSFLGVAWLILCLPRSVAETGWARGLLRAQLVMSLGLLPLSVWFFGQVSLAGVVANLLAVPLVTLLVVPLTLVGVALLPWPTLAGAFLGLAAWLMDGLWWAAGWLQTLPWAQVFMLEPSLWAVLLALLGCVCLLLPRGVPGKWLASLLLLPLLFPMQSRLADGELSLTMIDVGQGLSVLLRTRDHALLYDAGPAFTGGLDLGEAAVVPALHALGVRRLHMMMIGHADNDHAGGAGAVNRAFAPAALVSGEPKQVDAAQTCAGMQDWVWDAVRFSLLHPPEHFPELGNDSSCVLKVQTVGGSVLLPGDINQIIETRLLRDGSPSVNSTVLVVPHHGSSGSSSLEFVQAVSPRFALIASGHRNRFEHPRADVVERYLAADAAILGTVESGAISIVIRRDGEVAVAHRRISHRRFWHESAPAQ